MDEPDVIIGSVTDSDGLTWEVGRFPAGSVLLWAPKTGTGIGLAPDQRDELRELLDRAAMPGQGADRG